LKSLLVAHQAVTRHVQQGALRRRLEAVRHVSAPYCLDALLSKALR